MTLFPYTAFLEYYLLVYQPTFVGSNFLYPSGPYRFIIDKEKVIREVEAILTEFMSIMIGEKVNYKPNEEQREKLYAVLEILEENYNLNYNKMDINEQATYLLIDSTVLLLKSASSVKIN